MRISQKLGKVKYTKEARMRIPKGIKLVIALGLVVILLLAGCTKPAPTRTPIPTPTPTPTATPTPKPKLTPIEPYGDLTIGVSTFGGELFDPIKTINTCTAMMLAPMEGFLFDIGETGPAPSVVERWEMAPDGLSWIFYIRQGIKFHNGEDLTAADVKFSIDRYQSNDAYYSYMRKLMDHTVIVDDYTVRVYTAGTQPYFVHNSCVHYTGQGCVQPKDYIDQHGIDYYVRHPVGCGPWKFVRYVPGDMIEYEALDAHWRQAPAFKRLTIIVIPEEATRVAMLKTGEIDGSDLGLESANELEAAGFRALSLDVITPIIQLHGAYLPAGASMPIADIRVRQALSLAINRDEIIKNFFYGKASLPLPPYLPPGATDIDVSYWSNYCAEAYRYDLAEAKRLLKEAGYPGGFSIKLWTAAIRGAPFLPKMSEIISAYWATIGVKAEIRPIEWGALTKLRKPVAPELMGQSSTFRMTGVPTTPDNLQLGFHSTLGLYAMVGTAMPELDKLLEASMSEMDAAKRKDMVAKALKIAIDTYVSLSVCVVNDYAVIGSRIDVDLPKVSSPDKLPHTLAHLANLMKHKGK